MAKTYSVGVVGEANYQAAIAGLREGERVYLHPEPDNPHDPRAIAVRDGDGATIGYVPRDHWLTAALIDEGKGTRALVERIEGGDADRPNLGVVLSVELGEKGAPVGAGPASRPAAPSTWLPPSPAEAAARSRPQHQRVTRKSQIALWVVGGLIVFSLLGQCGKDDNPAEKAQTAAQSKAQAADAKAAVKVWYGKVMATAAVCDGPSKRFADQAQTIGSGGSTFDAYQLAKSAEEACRTASMKFDDIAVPAGISSALEEAIDDTTDTCELAYVGKQMAASDAKEIMDGNMSNSAISEFQEKVSRANAQQMACAARAMSAATQAGWTVDEIGKF